MYKEIVITALVIVTYFLGTPTMYASHELINDKVSVIVAEDKTQAADCHFWEDTPANLYPCPAGSVVFVRETTMGDVRTNGIKHYHPSTGNAKKDEEIAKMLVSEVVAATKGEINKGSLPASVQQSCQSGARTIGGDYLVDPNNANSTRGFFEVTYGVDFQCNVFNISDRSRVNAGTWMWLQSCIRSRNICVDRNITMTPNFTGFQPIVFGTQVGDIYTHISNRPCFLCGRPYTNRTLL